MSPSGHLCCSSYRFASSLVQRNPMVYMLDVWLQSGQVQGGRGRSTLDLKMCLLSSLTILWGQLEMAGVHRRLTNVSVHPICKLFQLFHHLRLGVPAVTYLPKCFVEPGSLFQLLLRWPHLSLAFEGAGPIMKHSSRGE